MDPVRRLFPLACLLGALPRVARAQAGYPTKAVRIIVSFPPGGASDSLARAVGRELALAWGQPVVPDNRGGANGTIAGQSITGAVPDGYTLGLVAIGHAVNPLMYRNLPYDTDRDFTPLSLIATYPQAIIVPPGSPAKDLEGFLRLARTREVPLTYSSGGNGSSQHLAGALFAKMAGLNLTHVPYKGGGPALMDVVAGTVDMMITQPPAPMLRTGAVRALAVTSARRLSWLPDVPCLTEFLPGYESEAWYGLVGPRGLPAEVLHRISQATMLAVRTQSVADVIATQGGAPAGSTPEEFASFIQSERRRYATIVAEANMTTD